MQTNLNIKFLASLAMSGNNANIQLTLYSDLRVFYMAFYVLHVDVSVGWMTLENGCNYALN